MRKKGRLFHAPDKFRIFFVEIIEGMTRPRVPTGRIVIRHVFNDSLLDVRSRKRGIIERATMYMAVTVRAQRYEVFGRIGAALSARDDVMYLQTLRRIAEGAAEAITAVYGLSGFVVDVCVHENASLRFLLMGRAKVKGGQLQHEARKGGKRKGATWGARARSHGCLFFFGAAD